MVFQGRHSFGDHYARSGAWLLGIGRFIPDGSDHIYDLLSFVEGYACMFNYDPNLCLIAVVICIDPNHPVQQCILRPVNSCIFDRVAGENGFEIRMDLNVSVLAEFRGQLKDSFLKDREKNVVRRGLGSGEFVINQSIAVFAG